MHRSLPIRWFSGGWRQRAELTEGAVPGGNMTAFVQWTGRRVGRHCWDSCAPLPVFSIPVSSATCAQAATAPSLDQYYTQSSLFLLLFFLSLSFFFVFVLGLGAISYRHSHSVDLFLFSEHPLYSHTAALMTRYVKCLFISCKIFFSLTCGAEIS